MSETKLTKKQARVFDYLTEKFKTVAEIAKLENTTRRAVYKIIEKLKKKGYLAATYRTSKRGGLQNRGGSVNPPLSCTNLGRKQPKKSQKAPKLKRVHGQQFRIKILADSEKYHRLRIKKKKIHLDGSTITLHSNSICVYSAPHLSFYGDTAKKAHNDSMEYWLNYFEKIESKLGIMILKGRNSRIEESKTHCAELQNELARDCLDKKEKIQVRDPETGKIWLLVDNSFGFEELETIQSGTAITDMDKVVSPFFNDLRGYYSEHGQNILMTDMLKALGRMAASHKVYEANINNHVSSIKELGLGVAKLTTEIEKYTHVTEKFIYLLEKKLN